MVKILECVPNFSEGQDMNIIRSIISAMIDAGNIKVLDVSSGKAANRTVVTFTGQPEDVLQSAFRGIEKAAELIDMKKHQGQHPRFGTTDVCPLIPLAGMEIEEVAELARKLAARVGDELGIPVYCYEYAAFVDERRNLADCRSGGYERLKEKIAHKKWRPDFGPSKWTERISKSGAVAIGARNILVAYNVNLDTTSAIVAGAIAGEVRESGRVIREGDEIAGRIITNENRDPIRIPGTLQKVRAIGWYLEDYDIAQVSMNLTDIDITGVYNAFEEVSRKASDRGIKVTGSELIGLIPLKLMLDAGRYYLRRQRRPVNISDEEIINVAVESLGLNDLYPFDPKKKIIEYVI